LVAQKVDRSDKPVHQAVVVAAVRHLLLRSIARLLLWLPEQVAAEAQLLALAEPMDLVQEAIHQIHRALTVLLAPPAVQEIPVHLQPPMVAAVVEVEVAGTEVSVDNQYSSAESVQVAVDLAEITLFQ
jgi:hypothetical protein